MVVIGGVFFRENWMLSAPFSLTGKLDAPCTIFSMKKLKYFFIFILYHTVSTCSPNCISANFMVVPVSSGPRMFLV